MKTDPETNVDDPDFPINPAYSTVAHNVTVAPLGSALRIAESVYTYSSVLDNPVYPSAEDAGWNEETRNLSSDSKIDWEVTDFAAIPAENIGRY